MSPSSHGKSLKTSAHSNSNQRLTSRETSPKKSRSRSRSKTRLQSSRSKELLLNMTARPAVIESADEDSDTSSAEEDPPTKPKTKLRLDTSKASEGQTRPTGPHTPISSEEQTSGSPMGTSTLIPETPDSYYVKSMLRPVSTEAAENRAYQTFLNMDDETEHSPGKETEQLMPTMSNLRVDESPKSETGVPFKELIDKLLILPANKSDSKFVPSFLCLYRAFATPYKLLSAVVDQFVTIERTKMVHFTKVAEMLRYLQVLAQWTATYPGDFASGPARDLALTFIQSIENSKVFAPAAREISNNLDTLIADEDCDWAFDDNPAAAKGKTSSSNHKKTPTTSSTSLGSSSNENIARTGRKNNHKHDDSDDENDGGNSSSRGSGVHSNASSIIKNYNASSQSYSNLMQLESAKLQAERLKPNPHIRLSKFQWHQFMEIPIDDLAREITRVDWTMYSSIRPRDFVRHVSLTTDQRRNSRRVDNISMMVKHFNHLALFVSGMILLRDKPKHRARALEKFMALAWKVRQLNNYNSLGAIVAGINGHEIARLNSTREMVPHEVQRQFLRLTILMGISRSHAAYRMAWDNSFTERIPFLPLVRQDLTMAASANQTFIGSNINWKKFEIMGDVIVGIQKSLEQPYSFGQRTSRTEEITRLILETKIVEESEDSADPRSELYDRSVQVEQTGADPRKKFDWLRR
ncbi:hypothetical protein LTR84_011196 [Exophiala bonariae]|uniref:Ras-GEF domain-containing protein n=1 Tax=Exophiala bonariae TaxID=1690606 RepID=A0AAV9NJI2_9EURO|nr:hypothetical protein LTR84_011196 [Exophiala bonariae]